MRIALLFICLLALAAPARAASGDAAFDAFVASAWPPAQAAGVSRETFARETAGLTPDPAIKARPAKQGEFSLPMHSYIAQVVNPKKVAIGRARAKSFADILSSIESRTGVPSEICLAIWGIESGYGPTQGGHDILRSVATLAVRKHRADFYRNEFVAALVLLQSGMPRENLTGSWAGAMGQPQFTPSSYLKFAVSYSGGGQADIWNSSADALASIANFLKGSGWNPAVPAVIEVTVPQDFDWKPVDLDLSAWRRLGFARADGEALPAAGSASLFLPEGAAGPAFLITENWEVIRQYNTSDAYALAVALLAERIGGASGLRGGWPKGYVSMSLTDRSRAQKLLVAKGLYSGATDGKIGRGTRNAVHKFQLSAGMLPADGLLTPAVLKRLQTR
ncbi:MAG: lytic murein transglycosylase [Methylobacteriaceae bacterium]|nr:lytic murein transglycosylase [Methylobacteriaceae bacterium]